MKGGFHPILQIIQFNEVYCIVNEIKNFVNKGAVFRLLIKIFYIAVDHFKQLQLITCQVSYVFIPAQGIDINVILFEKDVNMLFDNNLIEGSALYFRRQ